MEPISMAVMGASFGMGLIKNQASHAARQSQWKTQVAFQDAQTEFNNWQAGMNAKISNLNSQQKFWSETLQYNAQKAYAGQLENYEFSREIAQAKRVYEARLGAGMDYVVSADAIAAAYEERGLAEAVAAQQYAYRALQSSAAYQAGAQEGNSMDRYVNNFKKQMGDYNTIQQVNEGLQSRQYKREQLGQITKYLNQYNSQQFYIKQPIQQPLPPFPPLPALIRPAGPSMRGPQPMDTRLLDAGTSAMNAMSLGMKTNAGILQMAEKGGNANNNFFLGINRAFGGRGFIPSTDRFPGGLS